MVTTGSETTTPAGEGATIAVTADNFVRAETDTYFADALTRLLTDTALACRIAAGGRATVEARYDFRKVYEAWSQVYH